jgi:geranylgeranylglycerol-phosphate geranylgeranyltransferase
VNRPLISGRVTKRIAISFVLVMAGIGLLISFTINWSFVGLLITYLLLGVLYSTPPTLLKKRFLLKQFTIGLGVIIACLAGGAAVGIVSKPVIYGALLFFALFFGLNPIVDLRDLHGDKAAGRKTFPVVLGPNKTILIGFATIIVTSILTLLSYAWIGFNFLFPMIAVTSILFLGFLLYRMIDNWDNPVYVENVFIKKGMPMFFFIQVGMIVGVLPI